MEVEPERWEAATAMREGLDWRRLGLGFEGLDGDGERQGGRAFWWENDDGKSSDPVLVFRVFGA